MDFFVFILLSIYSASWNYKLVSFTKFRIFFSQYFFKQLFYSFLLSFWDCVAWVMALLLLSHRSLRLCSFFFQSIFFPLYCSDWVNSIVLYSSSLIFSFTSSKTLLSLSSQLFISIAWFASIWWAALVMLLYHTVSESVCG